MSFIINGTLDIDYYRNVFARLNSLSANERANVRALTGLALRVVAMSPARGVNAALAHGAVDPGVLAAVSPECDDPYEAWSGMLRRWESEFLKTARAVERRGRSEGV